MNIINNIHLLPAQFLLSVNSRQHRNPSTSSITAHVDAIRQSFLSTTNSIQHSASPSERRNITAIFRGIKTFLYNFQKYCEINNTQTANTHLQRAVDYIQEFPELSFLINMKLGSWGSDGYRAVHYAAWRGNCDAIDLLATVQGFDPNIKNGGGYRPLHTAIYQLQDEDPELLANTVKALIRAGADANGTTNKLHMPLQYAISYLGANGAPTYNALIFGYGNNRAALNCSDASGYAPFECAESYGFDLNNIQIRPNEIEGELDFSIGDFIGFCKDVINPFRSASQLQDDALRNARNNFVDLFLMPFAGACTGEFFKRSYEEGLNRDEIEELLHVVNADDDLDENCKTLAQDALTRYKDALTLHENESSVEIKHRAMDDFWCYFIRMPPLEVANQQRFVDTTTQSCNWTTYLQIAQQISKGVAPFFPLFGGVGRWTFIFANTVLQTPQTCIQICNIFSYIFNCNQSPD